jgi:hypothetical protein
MEASGPTTVKPQRKKSAKSRAQSGADFATAIGRKSEKISRSSQ